MRVSAVGFLFQDNAVKGKSMNGKSYSCAIYKPNGDGRILKNQVSSSGHNQSQSKIDIVSTSVADYDIRKSVEAITDKSSKTKFIGAAIKDGDKETEVHSIISDKLFAVRTKDENGRNHFSVKGRVDTQNTIASRLNLTA